VLRRNELRYVASAVNISIMRFCKNFGIDEYFLHAMPSFCQNVGIGECFCVLCCYFLKMSV